MKREPVGNIFWNSTARGLTTLISRLYYKITRQYGTGAVPDVGYDRGRMSPPRPTVDSGSLNAQQSPVWIACAPPRFPFVTSSYTSARLHTHRIVGGDRHHRRSDRHAAAGHPESARSRLTSVLHEQSASDRPGRP